MAANVSEIINNVFEKVFENPEISFSHPNRTFQYAVRHGKLNEDYLAMKTQNRHCAGDRERVSGV